MYRRQKAQRSASGDLDLDSLMDILSCLVGVMLFLVIYTVLELGSVAYEAQVPIGRETPEGSERVLVIANHGTVRVMDLRPPTDVLLSGFEIVRSFAEVSVFVDGNRRSPADPYFTYSLQHIDRFSADLAGTLDLTVTEREGGVVETVENLGPNSTYARILDGLSPEETWLSFVVDDESVEVFRRAREMALTRGFATSWDQLVLQFPMAIGLSAAEDDWLARLLESDKPDR